MSRHADTKRFPVRRTSDGPQIRVSAFLQHAGSVALVRHDRRGISYWLLPGGAVERGESLETAVVREVHEECGIDVRVTGGVIGVIETISPDDGATRHLLQLVVPVELAASSGACEPPILSPNDRTIAAAAWIQPPDLSRLELHPPISDLLAAWLDDAQSTPSRLRFRSGGVRWAPE